LNKYYTRERSLEGNVKARAGVVEMPIGSLGAGSGAFALVWYYAEDGKLTGKNGHEAIEAILSPEGITS
jgi:hypothetical protein